MHYSSAAVFHPTASLLEYTWSLYQEALNFYLKISVPSKKLRQLNIFSIKFAYLTIPTALKQKQKYIPVPYLRHFEA